MTRRSWHSGSGGGVPGGNWLRLGSSASFSSEASPPHSEGNRPLWVMRRQRGRFALRRCSDVRLDITNTLSWNVLSGGWLLRYAVVFTRIECLTLRILEVPN